MDFVNAHASNPERLVINNRLSIYILTVIDLETFTIAS